MLVKQRIAGLHATPLSRQKGVVLLITLIVLVAMTLAAIAMVRSVDTGNVIAGNLSFRQAATNSGDLGNEAAIAWLAQNNGGVFLDSDHFDVASPLAYTSYVGTGAVPHATPQPGQSWDDYWNITLAQNQGETAQVRFDNTGAPSATGNRIRDNAGNAVFYTIARLCQLQGATDGVGQNCALSTFSSGNAAGASQGVLEIQFTPSSQAYYRITTRVEGPRNTVSYVQTIIAM